MPDPKQTEAEEIRDQAADDASNTSATDAEPTDGRTQKPVEDPTEDAERPSRNKGLFSHIRPKTLFFGSLAIIALICFIIAFNSGFNAFLDKTLAILSPILVGCVLAYLCHPILEFFEYRLFRRMKNKSVRRVLSLFLTVVAFFAIIVLFILMIVPELVSSIQTLVNNYNSYANSLIEWLRSFITTLSTKTGMNIDPSTLDSVINSIKDAVGSLGSVLSMVGNWLANSGITVETAGSALLAIASLLKDLILTLFIAFYILASMDKRRAQLRKFRRAMFTEKQDKKITEVLTLTDRTFSGFLFSVLIDAIVVGILTFVMLSIFEISEYNLLIATTIAVTNVIPVFGPFIGAIPSAFIVLISNPTDPSKLLIFILLMLLIQQVDGNILCPKIQGDNTGVSSLSVLIAITVAGNLWGLAGMAIGVPIFAVIIELGKRGIENRLRAKGEPTDTTVYYSKSALTNAEKDVYYDHAGLRYEYEHSKFKRRVDKFRRNVLHIETSDANGAQDSADTTSAESDKGDKRGKRNKKAQNGKQTGKPSKDVSPDEETPVDEDTSAPNDK